MPWRTVLLRDEATIRLDVLTEASVDRSLSRLQCIRIVIAHRLSTIRNADLILVLEQGAIVEQGTHEDLLERGGHYAALVHSQTQRDGAADARAAAAGVSETMRHSQVQTRVESGSASPEATISLRGTCNRCGHALRGPFCTRCGAHAERDALESATEEAGYQMCSVCGKRLHGRFCTQCGADAARSSVRPQRKTGDGNA